MDDVIETVVLETEVGMPVWCGSSESHLLASYRVLTGRSEGRGGGNERG